MTTSSSPALDAAPRSDLGAPSTSPADLVGVWPEPAVLVDSDGGVASASPSARAFLDKDRAADAPLTLADFVGANAADDLLAGDASADESAEPSDVRARAVRLEGGFRIITLTDTVADHRIQAHLAQAERLSSIGELLSSVAHELTNPLTSVLGYAELLLTEEDAAYPKDELQCIRDEALRCRRIVSNLLDLARAESLELRPLSLVEVLEKVIEFRLYASKVREVELVAEIDPGLPPVDGDFHRLVQALLNLVTNAEHAVAARAAGRRVTLRARAEGAGAVLEVEDNGPGVPEPLREAIFQPFFTTKPRGKGTGLGLSLVRATTEAHGGVISVLEGADGGARFVIGLPASV